VYQNLGKISGSIPPDLPSLESIHFTRPIPPHFLCTYSDSWKKARITPIFKSEVRQKCDNYRPISILPIISKIFEKEVFDQLYEHLSQNLFLSKYQSGFRPKHSNMSALIQMCDQWLEIMDNGMLNGVVSLDIRKAFDSIDHCILLKKMNEQFGI
jgi:sarcosine oxidase/L-pipecolate oxidase